jgi:hypothetical protein
MIKVKGVTASIEFDGRSVTIIRGRMSAVGRGEKSIPVRSITAVQWKPHTLTTRGYIQFTVPGGNEAKSKLGSGTFDAAKDENSVLFTKQAQPEFQALREAVEAAIHGDPPAQFQPPTVPLAPPSPTAPSVAERLAQLTTLRNQGLVSPEQFEAKHQEILRDL